MASAGTVVVDFAAETAKFTAELKAVNSRLKNMESGFASLGVVAKTALGVLSVGSIISFGKAIFEAADAIGDMAARFGTTAETMSRLKFVAEQSDVEFQSLAVGIKTLQKEMSNAANGSDEAQKKFYALGLSASTLRNLPLEEQFKNIAQAFKDIKNPADQTRIAMELFGKAGADLVPLLNQGAGGIEQLTRKADELGITLKNNTAAAIGLADQALKQFKATASGVTANFLGNLLINFDLVKLTEPLDILQLKLKQLEQQKFGLLHTDTQNSDRKLLPGIEEEIERIKNRLTELQRLTNGGEAVASGPNSRKFRFSEAPAADLSKSEQADIDRRSKAMHDFREGQAEEENQWMALVDAQREEQVNKVLAAADRERQIRSNSARQIYEDQVALTEQAEAAKLAIEEEAAAARKAVEMSVVSSGIAALNAFNSASTKKSKELVAINKAVSIAQAIQNTSVAATKAIAQHGVFGYVSAAALVSFGMAQVAAIARTNYGSQGSANSSTTSGTSVNPVFTSDTSSDSSTQGATQQRVTQVIFNGPVMGGNETRQWLLDTISEAVNDQDVVLISPTSRQAQELIPS